MGYPTIWRTVSVGALVAALTSIATPAAAAQGMHSDGYLARGRAAVSAAAVSAAAVSACSDRAFSHIGGRWTRAVRWSFNASSTPASLDRAVVENVIRRSYSNITGASNDCGRADKVSAEHVYDGRTTRHANISRNAFCTGSDGFNVVSFGKLPRGILAATCTRTFGSFIIEADIRINTLYSWALSVASCANQELLEPTMTHEVGHVFGLGHVGEKRHPLLTMSTTSDGPCSNAASTLGLGDMLGLEALY